MRQSAAMEVLLHLKSSGLHDLNEYINSHPVQEPVSGKDPTSVQLQDMDEKMETLVGKIKNYCDSAGGKSRSEAIYRRLSEACVRYSIQLDRVNVIGRDEDRERRRQMLLKLDEQSTSLVLAQNNM